MPELSEEHPIRLLETKLKEAPVIIDSSLQEPWTFLDSFDWRLYNNDFALVYTGNELILYTLPRGVEITRSPVSTSPRFSCDLPSGPLARTLGPLLGIRALTPMAQMHIVRRSYRLLDKREKTVARLVALEAYPQEDMETPVGAYIQIDPIRGYKKQAGKWRKKLKIAKSTGQFDRFYADILAYEGKKPGDYSNKLNLTLRPDARADEAVKYIFRRLLAIVRANEHCIQEDIDSECLHDFRVALRKTRSLLTQTRGVFPPDVTERFRKDLSDVMSVTNDLRDLDVYLLDESRYRSLIAQAEMQDALTPVFDYLHLRRNEALERVRTEIASDRYAEIMANWRTFVESPSPKKPPKDAPRAAMSILALAQARIYKRYRRMLKDGRAALASGDPKDLHALRIDGKKLRYLLEFFQSLLPPKKGQKLITLTKKLQSNLGTFNDLTVQQDYLLRSAGELPVDDATAKRALMAVGMLAEALARQRDEIQAEFDDIFAQFSSPKTQALVREICGRKNKRGEK
jgi:CHAD domain-containing protein